MASLVAPSLHLERGSDMPFLPREPSPPRHVPRSPRRRRGGRWWLTGGARASPDSGEVISAEVALRSRPRRGSTTGRALPPSRRRSHVATLAIEHPHQPDGDRARHREIVSRALDSGGPPSGAGPTPHHAPPGRVLGAARPQRH